jgi:hypothetical protein
MRFELRIKNPLAVTDSARGFLVCALLSTSLHLLKQSKIHVRLL